MAYSKFKKLYTSLPDLSDPASLLRVINQLQSNIERSVSSIVSLSQNDSLVLSSVSLTAGKLNIVNHTLGKKLSGWNIKRLRGQARIWDTQDDNLSPQLSLYLWTDTDVVVDISVD